MKKLKIPRFNIRTDGKKFRKKIQLSVDFISHFPDIYTFSFAKAGENMHAFHALFSPASLQGRETGGSVRLCRTQTHSPFMLPEENTRPLPVCVATPLPFASNFRLFKTPKLNFAVKARSDSSNFS